MQLLTSFKLYSSYSCLEVYDLSCEHPIYERTQQELEQGFSLYPGGVFFDLLIDNGDVDIEIWQADDISTTLQAKRVIIVPFTVGSAAQIEVSVLVDGQAVSVPEGSYALVYETGYNDEDIEYNDAGQVMFVNTWCRFSFIPRKSVQVQVLRSEPVPWY